MNTLIGFNILILAILSFLCGIFYYVDAVKSIKEIVLFMLWAMLLVILVSSGCYLMTGGE